MIAIAGFCGEKYFQEKRPAVLLGRRLWYRGDLCNSFVSKKFITKSLESAGLASHGSKLNTLSPGRW
jgi:hypothetical protein